jgi:hypothetical protein
VRGFQYNQSDPLKAAAFKAAESEFNMSKTYPRRYESIVALENAIAANPTPAGKWSVETPGRFFITLVWTGRFTSIPHGFTGNTPWIEYGGFAILHAAGVATDRILSGDDREGNYYSAAIICVQG